MNRRDITRWILNGCTPAQLKNLRKFVSSEIRRQKDNIAANKRLRKDALATLKKKRHPTAG